MTRTIQILCAIVAALVFPSVAANAVEDTGDAYLTDFTLTSDVNIDTGPSTVSFAWTATAADDLSGVSEIVVWIEESGGKKFGRDTLLASGSGNATLPRYMPYATYDIHVTVRDRVGNYASYVSNGSPDLCGVDTPCQIVNAAP